DLTYEQLKHFYSTHYHPGNAIFMTYGDIPASEHQEKFQSLALQHFSRLDETIQVPDEKRLHAPIRVEEAYPLTDDENTEKRTHVVMGWLMGRSTDLADALS